MTTVHVLGQFFHGLTFLILCQTVAFIQYRSRRVLLARGLMWLGGFAACEATVAWNDLLVEAFPTLSFLPAFLRLALLVLGYTFLLGCGIQTILPLEQPRQREQLLWRIMLTCLVPYGIGLLGMGVWHWNQTSVLNTLEALCRYGLAFPGGALLALGLRQQSYQTLEAELRDHIRGYLQVVEVMLGLFGLLNLILVPPAAFFPADRLNVNLFPGVIQAWMWSGVGAFLAFGLTGALATVQLEIEQWIAGVERLQALAVDRERIGRDLHDGIIQSIYAAGLLLEGVQQQIPKDPARAQAQLGRVMDSLNNTIQDIRRYIFDLRSDMPDSDIRSGIERLLRDFHVNTLLETELEVTGTPVEILSIERRRHIFQIVREALANTARHAKAHRVSIHLHYAAALDITIADDGVGMETLLVSKGYGLRNIRERARLMEGTIRVESAPGEGVIFHLTVPY